MSLPIELRFDSAYRAWSVAKDILRWEYDAKAWTHQVRLFVTKYEDILKELFTVDGPCCVLCPYPQNFEPYQLWLWQDLLKMYHLRIINTTEKHVWISVDY